MFLDDIRKIPKIPYFQGGNDRQRAHLNQLVDALNSIRDASQRDPGPETPKVLTITTMANGATVDVIYTAYLPLPPT